MSGEINKDVMFVSMTVHILLAMILQEIRWGENLPNMGDI